MLLLVICAFNANYNICFSFFCSDFSIDFFSSLMKKGSDKKIFF